ncbi:uncharacterized protein TNCV_1260941 [Trichonephila clavipes]|nr:uncharacterized protein TNCV_1260941 [Trichonephila clavipes]
MKCLKTSYRTCMHQCPILSHRTFALEMVPQALTFNDDDDHDAHDGDHGDDPHDGRDDGGDHDVHDGHDDGGDRDVHDGRGGGHGDHDGHDDDALLHCQVIYSQFGLAIHQNDHQARRRFVEWAQNEIAVVPDLHKRILFSDEAHFWLNGYVNKQNIRIWNEANPQVYVETLLHPEKLTAWCALWAGGILLQKR